MKHYIEVFNKHEDELKRYIKTNITPEQVAEVYQSHPAFCYDLTPEIAQKLGLEGLDFDNHDYFLEGAREYEGETYEWDGEALYPAPLFLPDIFNSDPIRPGGER